MTFDDLRKMVPAAIEMAQYAQRCWRDDPGTILCERVSPCELVMTWEGGPFAKLPTDNWISLYPLHEIDALPWPLVVLAVVMEGPTQCHIVGRTDMPWPKFEGKEPA